MAMTYSGLVSPKTDTRSIAYWQNYSLLPVADLIDDAQSFIYGLLRCREMIASVPLTIAIDAASVALPADFLDPIALFRLDGTEIRHYDERNLIKNRIVDSAGVIQQGDIDIFSVFNEALQFDVAAGAATTFTLLYYARPAELAATTVETNFLTVRYPKLLRSAIMAEAYAFRKDAQSEQKERAIATALIQAANEEADLVKRGSLFPTERVDV